MRPTGANLSRAAVKKSHLAQADDEALVGGADGRIPGLNLRGQGLLDPVAEQAEFVRFGVADRKVRRHSMIG